MLNNLYIFFILILFVPNIIKLINIIRILFESISEAGRSYSLSEVLNRLTFKEFRIWCIDYLLSLDYHDIMYTTESEADLICKKEDDIYLVKCLRPKKTLALDEVQLLLGTMISEGIYKGIIITTSKANQFIYDYLDQINTKYKISIISQNDLKEEYDEGLLKQFE